MPMAIVVGLALIPYLDRNPQGSGYWFHRSRYVGIFFYKAFMAWRGILVIIGTFFRGANWGWIWPWTENYARH